MMISSGIHYIADKKYSTLYPIVVHLKLQGNKTIRLTTMAHTLEKAKRLSKALDYIDKIRADFQENGDAYAIAEDRPREEVMSIFGPQYMPKLKLFHPRESDIGKQLSGRCVGGHIDYKINNGSPFLVWVLAWFDDRNRINFVNAKSVAIKPDNADEIVETINQEWIRMMNTYAPGGELKLSINKSKKGAKFALVDYLPERKPTLMSELCSGLRECIH